MATASTRLQKKTNCAGIIVLHLPTTSIVANFEWIVSADEIYDIEILPDTSRPNIINTYEEKHHHALRIPGSTYWAGLKKPDLSFVEIN